MDVIKSEGTNSLCLDYNVRNTKVLMYRCHGNANQQWFWSNLYAWKGKLYGQLKTRRGTASSECLRWDDHRRRRHTWVGPCTNINKHLWKMEGCNPDSFKCTPAPTPPTPPPPPPCVRTSFKPYGGWQFWGEIAMDQTVRVTMGSTITNSRSEGTVAEVGSELSTAASAELQVCVGFGQLSPVSAEGCATVGTQHTASRSLRNALSSDSAWSLQESSGIQHSFSPRRAGLALWQFRVSSIEDGCDTHVTTKLSQFTWTESKYEPPVCAPHSCATEADPWGRCCSCNPPSDRLPDAVTPASCSSIETIRQTTLDRIQAKQTDIQSAQQVIDVTGDYCPGLSQIEASLDDIRIMLQDIQNSSSSVRI